jgi:cytochrome oxidase Cu insertion factor (SCO1/SenC/PrrC family)
MKVIILIMTLLFSFNFASAQVLGSCAPTEEGATPAPQANEDLTVQPIPLPGQYAIDFELPAVVGDEVKTVKLSDYNGKWRVLCFFPAAFTFV